MQEVQEDALLNKTEDTRNSKLIDSEAGKGFILYRQRYVILTVYCLALALNQVCWVSL